MGKGKKGKKEDAQPAASGQSAPAPVEKPSEAPLPLRELPAEFLGAFFELCFPDKRLLELCRELKITTPGYRLETLPPDQVARVLADEYLAAEDVRAPLETAARNELRSPAQEAEKLSEAGLDELMELVFGCATVDPLLEMGRVAWRCLIDPSEKRIELAKIAIEDGIKLLDAPRPQPKKAAPRDVSQDEAREAVQKAERAEKERLQMKEQLASARADIAAREQKLAEQRDELLSVRAELSRASAELQRLTAAGEGRALADARRAQDEARSLADKLQRVQAELAAVEERASAAERKLSQPAAQPQPLAEDEVPSAEEAAEFLVPILTREFYDSIERWDRRMQRAAFEKIHLLAQNWRHGSLRALQLEGVPDYYRIRIATDVRLIYRRKGKELEILSLIDREDLDRYIRQARTRQGEGRGKSEAPDAR